MSLSMFSTALSGLSASMSNIQVINHNVSNVNTPGYSRQDTVSSSRPPLNSTYGTLSIGMGVNIDSIRRIRDEYLDDEFRKNSINLGYNEIMQEAFSQIETLFSEPSDTSFSSVMNNFWESLSNLSKNPESIPSRSVFLEAAKHMINTFKQVGSGLNYISETYNSQLSSKISAINTYANQINSLNKEIYEAEVLGGNANDLRDKRDLVIDNLSKLIDIDVQTDSSGGKIISIDGHLLVGEGICKEFNMEKDINTDKNLFYIGDTSGPLAIKKGEIGAISNVIDVIIPNILEKIDVLISNISEEFNDIHKKGFDLEGKIGEDFFISATGDPIDLFNISINDDILKNPSKIALSSSQDFFGDNSNLRDLLELRNKPLIELNPGVNVTFDDFYSSLITDIGVQSDMSTQLYKTDQNVLNMINNNRMSVSGVSYDEEMTKLTAYQHAYNANAKMITTLDEMLETLIGML